MNSESDFSLFKSIYAAFLILVIHLLLVGGIGILVLFFYGIINHTFWMILGIGGLITGSGYWFLRHMKSDGKAISNVVNSTLQQGKSIEISFLGGIAHFKISNPQNQKSIENDSSQNSGQLASPVTERINDLTELARLYEKKLISTEEYNKAKQKFFS